MKNLKFRFADHKDMDNVNKILTSFELPLEGIDPGLANFIIAEYSNEFAGCAGLEIYGDIALGRSFAVRKDLQCKGIGKELLHQIATYAKKKEIKEIFILTTTADRYLSKYGFVMIDKNSVPDSIKKSPEFDSICPISAKCMKKSV